MMRRIEQVRHDEPHDLVRDKLKENAILRGQRPRRKLEELEVAGQRAHLAMKLAFNFLWPFVVDASLGIENGPVALADDRERLKHVVQNHSGRLRHSQFAANGVEAAIDPNRESKSSLAFSDPLFVAPVKPADCRRGGVVALLTQNEFAGHAANLRIGEVADQLLNRARSNLRPDVHEEDHSAVALATPALTATALPTCSVSTMVLRARCCCRASNSAVPSVEPSETMMISLMFG